METIKVNMNPNPLDVQTIHASQNDTEARQWEFELHNNGELIDTSDVTDQITFKAYKGGTEQILPENTSTPTTSPFKGDIRYPQGILSDQEFLYRESPTEEDGLAKITDIKGNTLVLNQLVRNGNFESISGWEVVRGTPTASNNVLSYRVDVLGGGGLQNRIVQNISIPANHKVFYSLNINPPKAFSVIMNIGIEFVDKATTVPNTWNLCRGIRTLSSAMTDFRFGCPSTVGNMAVGDVIQFKDVMLIDLTQMFGAGNEPTTVEEFTSLFTLPYYSYNQGSLLSFNGEQIKTVGKNQFNVDDANADAYATLEKSNGEIRVVYDGTNAQRYRGFYMYRAEPYVNGTFLPTQYTVSFDVSGIDTTWVFGIRSVSTNSFHSTMRATINSDGHYSFTFNPSQLTEDYYLSASRTGNKTTAFDITFSNIQMEFGTETSFVPYTSSTLSLPISTYFPNGMKSAGNVYDELTESKAITRIGSVDLGSLNWQLERANYNVFLAGVQSYIKPPINNDTVANIKCALYSTNTSVNVYNYNVDKAVGLSSGSALRIRDTSFSDANTFKQSLSGVYLYYEMVTPTETSFTTASLVTENAEIPLSNNDGTLIGKCTEELSAEPGFHDAKIKLADEDGECYSNKIQLHVERSPQ